MKECHYLFISIKGIISKKYNHDDNPNKLSSDEKYLIFAGKTILIL